jgi:hypothetical protein
MRRITPPSAWLVLFVLFALVGTAAARAPARASAPPIYGDEWFKAHGATGSLDQIDFGWGCEEVAVGPDAVPALACSIHDEVTRDAGAEPVFRALVRRVVRLVRNGKIVTVLDVITNLDVYDAPGPNWPSLFALELRIKGEKAVLDDNGKCAKVPARQSGDESRVAWHNLDRDMASRMCKARGTYRWKRGRFVRGK